MQERLDSMRSTSAQACMQPLRERGLVGERVSRPGGVVWAGDPGAKGA